MSLKGRIRRLETALAGEMDYLELEDGSRYYFRPEDAGMEVFLSELNVGRAVHRGESKVEFSELIRAVARATPESRRRFIEQYRDPFTGPTIVARGGGRVRFQWCDLGGVVQTSELDGEQARKHVEEWRASLG